MKWMTKKEVMELTGISRYELNAAIKSGKLRFQIFNKRMKFTEKDVEIWQNNTICHSDYINAVKSTTRTSRSYPKQESAPSLESRLAELKKAKQPNIASKGFQKLTKRAVNLQMASYPA